MRQTIFPRREIFEQNHIDVPSGKIAGLCRIGRNIRYEKSFCCLLNPYRIGHDLPILRLIFLHRGKRIHPLVQPLHSLLLPLCIARQIQILLIDTDIGKEIDRVCRESTPVQNRQLSQEKHKNERENQQSNHMPVFVFRGIIPLLFILHFGYSNETTKIEKGEWRKKNSPYLSTELPPISAFHTKIGKDLYLRTIPSKFHSSHSHFLQFSPSSRFFQETTILFAFFRFF